MLGLPRAVGRALLTGLMLLLPWPWRPERMAARVADAGRISGLVVLLGIAFWAAYDWISAESDQVLDWGAVAMLLGAVALLIGLLASIGSPHRRFEIAAVVGGLASIATWIGIVAIAVSIAWDTTMERLQLAPAVQGQVWQGCRIAAASWAAIVVFRLGRIASAAGPKRIGGALVASCLVSALLLPSRPLFDGERAATGFPGLLQVAYRAVDQAFAKPPPRRPPPPRIDVEATYYRQPALVQAALAGLSPSRPDRPEIYFVGAATFAGQHVFMREVRSARAIVDARLGTAGRSLLLINHPETTADVALANTANLAAVLGGLKRVMDPEKDLLFLYITSHGSPGEIAVQFPGFSPTQLTPDRLARMLLESGIKHRLVVLSACFSGSFMQALQGPDAVVMTAARADRTSFGCSDERDWTYFGDALFNHALRETHSALRAFDIAKGLVATWEAEQKVDHPSEPQITAGPTAVAKLEEIAGRLAGTPQPAQSQPAQSQPAQSQPATSPQ